MKILSMTATFGKLEHETLTLQPGLNIIEAPNEWGKSTWCAFILAMLYGIDTRQQTTKAALADKEHFAPWSGRPMSGRMDILWQDRRITLERSSKGRTPFGSFSAYETDTGLSVPELTADNCGLLLLGVERAVFCRSGFIRLSNMPVTQDETLRRRLNALVTTGDDSGAADLLAAKLNKLKNTCRSNSKNGLLPQALAQQQALQAQLEQLTQLQQRKQQLLTRQRELQLHLKKLQLHKDNLRYQSACEHHHRLSAAQTQEAEQRARLEALQVRCEGLPSRDECARKLEQLNTLTTHQQALYMELQFLPEAPKPPRPPFFWYEAEPDEVDDKVRDDVQMHAHATKLLKKKHFPLWLLGLVLALAGGIAAVLWLIPGLIAAAAGILLTVIGLTRQAKHRSTQRELIALLAVLTNEYGTDDPSQWGQVADTYRTEYEQYRQAITAHREEQNHLRQRSAQLEEALCQLCAQQPREALAAELNRTIALWDELADTLRQLQQLQGYVHSLEAVVSPAEAPAADDPLTHSAQDTDALIADTESRLRQLQQELGHCDGQMEALESESALHARLTAVSARVQHLSNILSAITLAQETLQNARAELQKRFAPQISRRAQELFSAMTDGHYDRLSLTDDLTLRVGADGEDTLKSALWRSDGTADQLYLALRLAVSEALTPDAPLVLDDALVRFDDKRLKTAMELLQQEPAHKQIILFTCQSRERSALSAK